MIGETDTDDSRAVDPTEVPGITEPSQDPLKSFLEKHQGLFAKLKTEPKAQEEYRIKAIEEKLLEMVQNKDLKRFLEEYSESTGKPGRVTLIATNPSNPNPPTLALDSDGVLIYYPLSPERTTRFQLVREKFTDKADSTSREFYSEEGELERQISNPGNPLYSQLGSSALHVRSGSYDGFMIESLFTRGEREPFIEYSYAEKRQIKPTWESITNTTVLGLQVMAREMPDQAPTSPSTPLPVPNS